MALLVKARFLRQEIEGKGRPRSHGRLAPHAIWAIAVFFYCLLCVPSVTHAQERGLAARDGASWMQRAAAAASRGNYLAQIDALTKASKDFEKDGKATASREALRLRAEAYLAYGDYSRAIEELQELVASERKAKDRTGTAWALSSLGAAYFVSGRLTDAEQSLTEAARSARASQKSELLGAVLQNLANVLTKQQRHKEARSAYRELITIARKQSNQALLGRAYLVGARVENNAGNKGRMRSLLSDAYDVLSREPEGIEKAAGLVNVARVVGVGPDPEKLSRSDLALAARALEAAREVSDNIGNPSLNAYASGYLGRIRELQGRTEEALDLTGQAIMHAQQINAAESLYLWEWQAGRLYDDKGHQSKAVDAYRRAILALEKIRGELFESAQRGDLAYQDTVGPLYQEFASLLLGKSGSAGQTAGTAKRLKEARNAIESLRTVELQDYFLDDCVTATQARAMGVELAAATRDAAKTIAVLYPILLESRAELIVTLPDGTLRQHTVKKTSGTISSTVRRLQQGLYPVEDKAGGGAFAPPVSALLAPAQRLHRWFIEPIESELKRHNVDTLVVVPDADLRTVPFGVFHNGQRYLIQDYAIAVTPGLTLTEAQPLSRWELRGLFAGLTTDEIIGEGVKQELAAIETIFGKSKVTALKNKDFSVRKLQKALDRFPYSVVHLASHARFGGTPENNYIETYGERLTMDKLEGLMQVRRFSDEAVELLVLSGCETAQGDIQAALGLSGLAIKAGARSAVGALWKADSIATADIFSAFYEALQADPSLSKAKALQQAQKRMIELAPRDQDDHPTVWAPFILIGNWL